MTTDRDVLARLCARHGVLTSYSDIWGQPHEAPSESLIALLAELDVEAGSTEAALASESRDAERGVSAPRHAHAEDIDRAAADAPLTCFEPDALGGDGRVWGPAIQLYALRSQRNWGIGDFGDLLAVIDQWAARGASLVGLNPLHALFAHNPAHVSPYSPSSRLRLNTIYIDVDAVGELAECEEAVALIASAEVQAQLAVLRAADMVRYPEVAALKTRMLRLLHAQFAQRHRSSAGSARGADYRVFVEEGGAALLRHARFEALQGHFFATDSAVWGWPVWPEAYRSPDAPAVEAFAAEHAEEVGFHLYLQWLADRQLAAARQRCVDRGMAVGLYLDLAVSVDRAGSDAWSHADLYARGATIGAPPDEVNPNGQGWGLPPLRPDRMGGTDHALFTATIRAAMRHAGALRIDHVMGLMRLFWIPPNQSPATGAYVLYPLDELVTIVASESRAHRCLVIGEDLGTVADAIRVAMARHRLLSYRLLYFERSDDGAFKAPEAYPRRALVAISTHDLPTLAGWWTGHDLVVRQRLGLFPAGTIYEQQLATRAQDRMRLLLALERAGLLPAGVEPRLDAAPQLTEALAEAVHAYVASSAAEVMLVQLEDVLGVEDQANLPGTVDQHPNWRQRLPLGLEAMATDARFESLAKRIASVRPRPQTQRATAPSHDAIVPRATYRLQFHKGFGFDDAVRILPYLQRLGVSHVYCSPILRARAGSTHGYDVVGHDEINPELGGEAGFERFTEALRAHGMGQLLDMVPNHMGVLGSDNAWWNDVVENGISSPFADYFDIDWHPVNPELEAKVLLPVLGRQYGDVLDAGELVLAFDAATGSFAFTYFTHRFPLDPRSTTTILEQAAANLPDDAAAQSLRSLATAFSHLPPNDVAADSPAGIERRRDQTLLKQRLAALGGSAEAAIAGALAVINAAADKDALHALHERQAYRLAFWRVAADEINYRRFFDINELAGLRMEDPRVFEATQGFSLDLAAAGKVDGLRIDHPDGLQNPAEYFARLQDGFARRTGIIAPAGAAPFRPLYVVAEKIAASHESVPAEWRIHGTTGYRFAMVVNGVLVDADSAGAFDAIWARFAPADTSFAELAYAGKRAVASSALASELTVLATALLRIAKGRRQSRDYTFNSLRSTLAEIAACLPVYRTYVVDTPSTQDDRYIDWAVAHARQRSRLADLSIFDFTRSCMRNEPGANASPEQSNAVRRFALRFQQFSSPVAAKGVEDTAFYQYHRLVSLNEVGGDPATFGISTRAFHAANADRQAHWPDTIIATSTHDNKRSEDVRCRLDVLSEMPEAWSEALDRWQKLSSSGRGESSATPSPADEYLFYQTVLGTLPAGGLDDEALPAYRERVGTYLLKAVREGKERSSWTQPDEAYEAGLDAFVQSALARVHPNPLLSDVQALATELAWFGALNSLSMALLKYTVPGVPDLYQGNELLDFSLVDPDNRRAVDYDRRGALLAEMDGWHGSDLSARVAGLAASPTDGRAKLWLIHRLLRARADLPQLFRRGDYKPLAVRGSAAAHVVAFTRSEGADTLVVVAGRLFARLASRRVVVPVAEAWGDTALELPHFDGAGLDNLLTGATVTVTGGAVPMAAIFATLPVAAFLLRGGR
jgi:(1->4)-alpha-D-glucan 1-alpha-D-glucosylmutase